MPTILNVFVWFIVLYGGHVHCKNNGYTAGGGVYDITEFGAAPSSKDNKDVSAV